MKEMNILMSSDNNYLRYSMVTIASLFANHPDVKFNICIINSNLDLKHIKEVTDYVESCGNTISIINIDDSIFAGFPINRHYTVACYYILIAHQYLPVNMERILYLDGDIIIDKDIYDFYNTDFDNNYIITCGHILGDTLTLAKNKSKGSGAQGNYFNSGVIIFNLNKFRENITIDSYKKACEELNYDFFLDQGLLNYMFADKAKYMPMLDYNFRFSIFDEIRDTIHKNNIHFSRSIIHYTLPKPHYKPWELLFSKEEMNSIKLKKETAFFNISDEANDLVNLWWKYAKMLPKKIYQNLYKIMTIQKTFFLKSINTYANIITTQKNDLSKTYAFEETLKKKIKQLQKDKSITYLESMALDNTILSQNIAIDKSLFLNNFNEQFKLYETLEKHLLVLVCAKDNASTYWKNIKLDKFKPSSDLTALYRYSYVAIYDNYLGFIYEKNSPKKLEKNYCLPFFNIRMISMGYEPKTMACCSKIIINNTDFSLNQTGLNFVVIDLDNLKICDSYAINFHSDLNLKIKRAI